MLAAELSGRDLGRQITVYLKINKQMQRSNGKILSITHDQYGVRLKLANQLLQLNPKEIVLINDI